MSEEVRVMNEEVREITSWRGRFNDSISWEVVRREGYGEFKFCWNTYMYINGPDELVDELWSKDIHVHSDGASYIYPSDLLSDLKWNGGHTLYQQCTENFSRYIKIGDDYQHSWDRSLQELYTEQYMIKRINSTCTELAEKLKKCGGE